ncbi:MAG: DNA mismatch repair protein MutL [Verrucomicrobiales bacterium]|nr:DNA mismatch repair protein MutL [Verrucomicrobiales bacterium]
MGLIHLLSEKVSNQIAAGEVVERPASVVKELVENSLDAGATRISIEIQAGGRSMIRVTDNGKGMSRDDALLCLERHATSKINIAEDLDSINTMGFRGEAIPSIASVSRMSVTTMGKDSDSPEGTRIEIHGGKIRQVESAGHAVGTTVEVRSLFFNLPARRKFLRSPENERTHIQHFLTLLALANPQIGFVYIQDNRRIWELAPCCIDESLASRLKAVRERMGVLHGEGVSLLDVQSKGEYSVARALSENAEQDLEWDGKTSVSIWGLIGAPGVSRSNRSNQHLFVNRRPVENKALNRALMEGYHTSLMKGQFPVCCLFLEIDPAEVDVNIHPAKREVKFHHERDVRKLLSTAIKETLLSFHRPQNYSQSIDRSQDVVFESNISDVSDGDLTIPDQSNLNSTDEKAGILFKESIETKERFGVGASGETPEIESTNALSSEALEPVPLLSVSLKLVGVVGKLYVVLESEKGLVLMDQHAAHERVLYEQMLRRMEQDGEAPSQKLLLPETVDLPPKDAKFLQDTLQTLNRLGVGISEFGDRTFLLDALPPFLKDTDARKFVLELIDKLRSAGEEVNVLRLGEDVIAKTVCRHAVKANDLLREEELQGLLDDLRSCKMPYTCPHGRPTIIEMTYSELEKKFGRIQ